MAKKNFTDSLIGNNRSKKLDMLVTKSAAEPAVEATPKTRTAPAKKTTLEVVEKSSSAPVEKGQVLNGAAPKKRGRKKKDIEKDSFFYTVDKEFLFQVKAAAFWDRRDISEFITRALKHYMETEMGDGEVRRAVREFKSRLEE